MSDTAATSTGLSIPIAAAIATSAFTVPLLLSASSVPSPNHPRILLWYKSLKEPRFKPPDVTFPLAWTVIEAALAAGGYRLARAPASGSRTRALALWSWNVFMIGGWSRLFFKQQRLGISTVAAAGLVVTSAALIHQAKPVDRLASRAALPLLGWAAFATVLTATIWSLNPRRSR